MNTAIVKRFLLIGLFGLIVMCSAALLQPDRSSRASDLKPTTPDAIAAITTRAGDETQAAIAYSDQADTYLVAWRDYISGTATYGIYGRRVDINGSPLASEFALSNVDTHARTAPDVVYNPTHDEFFVVWEYEYSPTDHDLYARRVASNGSLIGGEIPIATATTFEQRPSLTYNAATDEYLIAWELYNGSDHDIYAQRFTYTGSAVGGAIVIASGNDEQAAPVPAFGVNAGRYLVVWQGRAYGTEDFNIYGQRVTADGVLAGSIISITTWEYSQVAPDVAYNSAANEYLVVWEDHHWGWGADWDIYGQRVDYTGALIGGNFGISWDNANHRMSPAVAYKANANEYLVAWEYEYSGSDHDIYRRRVASDGSLPDTETYVAQSNAWENTPAIAADDQWAYFVAWEDNRDTATQGINLYGDRVNLYQLSGYVFDGNLGVETNPFAGVTVELRCSSGVGITGTLKASTVTNASGWYGLITTDNCDYYNLWQIDQPGYQPVGATSIDGAVVNGNWIQYAYPLTGKVWSGNKFWDSTDPPPSGWSELVPSEWITHQTTIVSARVQDTGSGLNVSSGQYSYSTDGGSTWSAWQPADCTGSNGTTAPQRIGAPSVAFGQDTVADSNQIKFRIADMNGNVGVSPNFVVKIDTTPPANPVSIVGDRQPNTWSNQTLAVMTWNGQWDQSSGVHGFSYQWSSSPSTLPDAITETVATAVGTLIPADGTNWYFHVRTVDVAGNWASSASHVGPYWLDTVPPDNPTTLFSGTHQPFVWSNNNLVTCQWSGAGDDRSGIAGYSVAWDHSSSTVPDATVDTSFVVMTSPPLADANDWYCHVRSIDQAGNGGSGAAHHGPFYIDTTAPSSSVAPLSANQATTSFNVSWSGTGGSGAPIAGYDVKVADQYGSDVNTIYWFTNTLSTSATFNGVRGHTYYFSSRARDQAGNQESYPTIADAITTVGKDVTVRVRDEYGNLRVGAKVYFNGAYLGVTDSSGLITAHDALNGDQLAALYLVYTQSAVKPYHTLDGGGNWAWRAYQTSVGFANDGTPQLFTVSNINTTQDLTVRRNQPLIGGHLIVSVQWDANGSFLNDTKQGLLNASNYLYDVTDGQFFWEVIEVFDDETYWSGTDMQIHASNTGTPVAAVWGITGDVSQHINLARYWNGNTGSTGNWSLSNGYRTMIHEYGHYGLGLWDEYLDRNGAQTANAFCATNFNTTPVITRASIMDYQYTATELCSDFDPNHHHRTETQHDALSGGESTWETVLRRYADSGIPARWTLRSPVERGFIMAGPNAIPINAWQKVYVTNYNTGACAPFMRTLVYAGNGAPVDGAEVGLKRPGRSDLSQGLTNAQGQIVVFGARNGDTLYAKKSGASASTPVICTPEILATGSTPSAGSAETIVLQPDPFNVEISIVPMGANVIQVRAAITAALSASPIATIWQTGVTNSITLPLTFNAGLQRYIGETALDPAFEWEGYVDVHATDDQARTVQAHETFELQPIVAAQYNPMIYSDDGNFELVLPAGALNNDAVVAIQPTTIGTSGQGDLVRAGQAYQVFVSTGQSTLNAPAVINMRYDGAQTTHVDVNTLQLYRWNEATHQWTLVGGLANDVYHIVSANVDQLSVFAILGQRIDRGVVYLPIVLKQ